MWGNNYTHTLLVGLQIGATILESSMEIPQKTWKGATILPNDPTTWHISKGLKISILQ